MEIWHWDGVNYLDPYDRFKKQKEQKMRNQITVIDKNIPPLPRITDLKVGQMFRYPKGSNDQNVYMVTNHSLGRAVVLLATGIIYSDFNSAAEIEVVDNVSISSPLQ